jgi:hypothetical protein
VVWELVVPPEAVRAPAAVALVQAQAREQVVGLAEVRVPALVWELAVGPAAE